MSLPRAFLDEIRARVPLSDIIGKRMKLVRAGREYKGCCPFHNEKTPSFYVNDQKAFYHCFGCGAHGDVIRFLTDHDNLRFMEAVEQLAGLAGLQVPKPTPEEEKRFKRQMSLYDLMEVAAKYYAQELQEKQNRNVLEYLLARGISSEMISGFRLGCAPSDGEGLKRALAQAGFGEDDMIEAGLFRRSDRRKGEVYPFFRDRVMFPVMDFQGRVVAFGGRVLPGADKSAPKYVNSPETAIFHKGRNLYGLSRSRKAVGEGETVIVVEGYMDVIALHQAGYRAAVAPLGTALTESQVEALWRVMPEGGRHPVLCFDGDAAGQRAAGRALDRVLPILRPDHTVRFAFLPEKHDPDSLIREEGRGAMDKVLQNAASLFEMMWAEEARGRNLALPETRAGFRAALIKRARAVADGSVQEFFIHEINQKINEIFLSNKLTKKPMPGQPFFRGRPVEQGAHTPYRPLSKKVRPLKSARYLREKALIATVIHYPELYDTFAEDFGMMKTDSHDFDRLRQELICLLNRENGLDYQAVKQHLIGAGYGEILDVVLAPAVYTHAGFAKPGQPHDIVRQGWRDAYDRGPGKARTAW